MRIIFGLMLMCLVNTHVLAWGEGVAIVTEIRAQTAQVVKQLKEMKSANDSLKEIYETSGKVYEEYKFVRDFSIEGEIRRMRSSIEGVTNLHHLGQASPEGKFRLLRAEIRQRYAEDKNTRDDMLRRVDELERIEQLQKAKLKEAEDAAGGRMTDKNINASNASSAAILAVGELERMKQNAVEKANRRENAEAAIQYDKNYREWLRQQSGRTH